MNSPRRPRRTHLILALGAVTLVALVPLAHGLTPAASGQAGASAAPSGTAAPTAATNGTAAATCEAVCANAKRQLATCATSTEGGDLVAASARESARIDQLDCAKDCAFWTPEEVKRVDTCLQTPQCDTYTTCMSRHRAAGVPPRDLRTRKADGAEVVLVPAGPFTAGSPELGRDPDEMAATTVDLPAFWIDRDEVTVERYMRCYQAGACTPAAIDATAGGPPAGSDGPRQGCNWGIPGKENHPINCITQLAARDYCRFVGARLPSELEWEKAARGPAGRRYPWGNMAPHCDLAHGAFPTAEPTNYRNGCGTLRSAAVGTHPGGDSPWGVHDMGGNVWEWVGGHYERDTYADPKQDEAPPTYGDSFGVLRGGGWGTDRKPQGNGASAPETAESQNRFRIFKHLTLEGVGFRCAQTDSP